MAVRLKACLITFEEASGMGQRYDSKVKNSLSLPVGPTTYKFKIGESINLPFLHITLDTRVGKSPGVGSEFFIKFLNFDSVVNSYQKGIIVNTYSNNSPSVLVLSLAGLNKSKIVDFLNTTSVILSET